VATLPQLSDFGEFIGQDLTKSFWNGTGKFTILAEDIADALGKDPDLTVGALRARLIEAKKPLLVQTGLDFTIDAEDPLRLGTKNGGAKTQHVAFSAHVDVDARAIIILSADTFASLQNQHPEDLGTLLHDHTALTGQDALIVIAAGGDAGAEFSSTVLSRPGVNVGISFKAGAAVNWVVCRPARDGDKVLEAFRQAFKKARLPQSDPDDIVAAGGTVTLGPNEVISTSFNGFMSIGGEATFGYDTSGTTNYAIGKLDLATKLVIKARAKVSVGYSLTGAFRTTVLPGDPGWVRVMVEKDRTSTFDFGVGVTVDAKLKTTGLPSEGGGLALLESIFGFHTPQVAQQVLELAHLSPDELRKKADGAIKGFVETWAGKAFDELKDTELGKVFDELSHVANEITHADARVVALYEQYVVGKLESALDGLETIIGKASLVEQRKALLAKISDEKLRSLVELLIERSFGSTVVSFEQVAGDLKQQVEALRAFVTTDAEEKIRTFIEARTQALGLAPLVDALKKIDTPKKLKDTTVTAVVGLAERLSGMTVDKLLASPEAGKVIKEINDIAKGFDQVLEKINDVVTKALNAQGRFELSYAYQRVRSGHKLVDVQIHVDQADPALRQQAHQIYRDATSGHFDKVLTDAHVGLVRVASAAFTDSLKKVGTLKVNVFGWNYQEVKTMLVSLEGTVKESPTGLLTVYAIKAKGESITESRKRTVALGYTFQVAGQVKGAFEDAGALRQQTVDAFETLNRVQGELDYTIKDTLTHLDELRSYLEVGRQLNVLTPGQTARLIGSIQELRRPANGAPAALVGDTLKGVDVTYTVGFAGDALTRALTTDLTGTPITWWKERGSRGDFREPTQIAAPDHQTALKSIYAECLIASFVLGRTSNRDDYAVASMYKLGWLVDLNDNPNVLWPSGVTRVSETRATGEQVFVSISEQAKAWARFHYFVDVALARFLHEFRESLQKSRRQPLGNLEEFLKDLVSKLQQAGQGDQASLPFILLDELVRRTSPAEAPEGQEPRRALLEVTLLDDKGKPANRIPIIG